MWGTITYYTIYYAIYYAVDYGIGFSSIPFALIKYIYNYMTSPTHKLSDAELTQLSQESMPYHFDKHQVQNIWHTLLLQEAILSDQIDQKKSVESNQIRLGALTLMREELKEKKIFKEAVLFLIQKNINPDANTTWFVDKTQRIHPQFVGELQTGQAPNQNSKRRMSM